MCVYAETRCGSRESSHVKSLNRRREAWLVSLNKKRILSTSPSGARGGVTLWVWGRPATTSNTAARSSPQVLDSCASREPPSETGHVASFAKPESNACRSRCFDFIAQLTARKHAARISSCAGAMPAAASRAEWWARRGRPMAALIIPAFVVLSCIASTELRGAAAQPYVRAGYTTVLQRKSLSAGQRAVVSMPAGARPYRLARARAERCRTWGAADRRPSSTTPRCSDCCWFLSCWPHKHHLGSSASSSTPKTEGWFTLVRPSGPVCAFGPGGQLAGTAKVEHPGPPGDFPAHPACGHCR